MKNPILDQFVPKKYTENDEESFLDTKLDFVHTPTHPLNFPAPVRPEKVLPRSPAPTLYPHLGCSVLRIHTTPHPSGSSLPRRSPGARETLGHGGPLYLQLSFPPSRRKIDALWSPRTLCCWIRCFPSGDPSPSPSPSPPRWAFQFNRPRVRARHARPAQSSVPWASLGRASPAPCSAQGSAVPPRPGRRIPTQGAPQRAGFARASGRGVRAPPHLRVCTAGLYLPLFLFLNSEFMVALGVRRRAGSGSGLGAGR